MGSEFKVFIHLSKIVSICTSLLWLLNLMSNWACDFRHVGCSKGAFHKTRLKRYYHHKDDRIMFICSVGNTFSEYFGMKNLFTA